MNIAMVVDGVLHGRHGAPLPAGVGLYRSLATDNRILLISDNVEADTQFLLQEGLTDYAGIHPFDPLDLPRGTIVRTLSRIRTRGLLSLVVSADPSHCRQAFTGGYSALLFMAPAWTRPAWHPDYDGSPRPWDELVEEVVAHKAAEARKAPPDDE